MRELTTAELICVSAGAEDDKPTFVERGANAFRSLFREAGRSFGRYLNSVNDCICSQNSPTLMNENTQHVSSSEFA